MGTGGLDALGVVMALLAHMGGIDEIGIFLIPALVAIFTLRWVEKRTRSDESARSAEEIEIRDQGSEVRTETDP